VQARLPRQAGVGYPALSHLVMAMFFASLFATSMCAPDTFINFSTGSGAGNQLETLKSLIAI
jgi:hypothetical protein